MKRLATAFVVIALSSSLMAQAPAASTAVPPAAPAVAAPAAPAAAPAASPVPSGDENLSGFIDLGYRWETGVYGSLATYRSIVDLGSGPKLLGTEFTILNPTKRFFDRIDVRAYNWGDDPYSTAHIDVSKSRFYQFSADYRNIAYYSNLPAFADPLLAGGTILDEQALDTRQRIGTYRLELFPGARIVPYLEYEHNANNGTGVSTFVTDANEYPVNNLVRSSTENYRGGVRVELNRLHVKLEQGGTTYKDDEQMNAGSGQTNYGNFLSPILGQTTDLTSLAEAWSVRGHSVYTDGSFSANPASWVDLYGSILYSEPVSNVNFTGVDTGNQVLFSQLLFYTGEQNLISAVSKLPHVSGSAGAEFRPVRRLRLIPSWLTDRMHTSGSNIGAQNLTTTSGLVPISSLLTSSLVTNTNQVEMNVLYELTRKITLRGGYRYVWGNASDLILPLAGLAGLDQGKIRRNVAIAGLTWHPLQNAWVNVDFEDGSSGSTYYRTSLYNYQKARIRGRHQISPSFSVSASASVLNNQDPLPGLNYSFLAHQESASVLYAPSSGKVWDFEGGYTRSTLRSNINYLDPEFLTTEQSSYRDNSHTVTAMFDLNMPARLHYKTKLTLGGSAFLSSGSNPSTFYQPTAKLSVAVHKNLSWISEWRYYGFDESFYLFQSFRTQMVTTGVRITR